MISLIVGVAIAVVLLVAAFGFGWTVAARRAKREMADLADEHDGALDDIASGTEQRWAAVEDLAHELRNPLAVMATSLDVALGDDGAIDLDLRRSAEVVRRSVDRAATVVDDLIIFARNETPEARRTDVDLYQLLEEVVAEHQGPIEAQGLTVDRRGTRALASGDREALKRAIGNIVGNAVRLSRPNSVLRIGAGSHQGYAWVGVDDQGPGLDPREHEDAFRRHWSHDRVSLNGEARTGLGLAITRQIAEQHGGLVTLRSELGAGSEFVIWVPDHPDADAAAITIDGIHPVWSPLQEQTIPAQGSQR